MHSLTARLRALAALHALALTLLCTACNPQLPSAQDARMGAVVQPSTQTRQGSSGTTTFFSAAVATASADSNVLDCGGFSDAWVDFAFDGVDADTDLVAHLEVRSGNRPTVATQSVVSLDATLTLPASADWPTGLTLDTTGDDGIDVAATMLTDAYIVSIPMRGIGRYLSLRYTYTSGGTDATLTATGYCR